VVENGPAWRVLDDELEQLHRRIGQASSGFDEEDSEVIRVRGEVPEDGPIPSLFSRGPDLLDPRDTSSWEDRVAVGVEHRSGEVDGRGGIADCHIDVSPVGGGDETKGFCERFLEMTRIISKNKKRRKHWFQDF
jgi:hypothetical protein